MYRQLAIAIYLLQTLNESLKEPSLPIAEAKYRVEQSSCHQHNSKNLHLLNKQFTVHTSDWKCSDIAKTMQLALYTL